MPNRLADALSPYLRSHAGNPVDWWPWSAEAFAEARRRDVPVLISIGYATCHWCHVMARETFSDPEIAAVINERFVAIKVDREEHPQVDATYLAAAAAFTDQLGWPLTIFATPDGRTFHAGSSRAASSGRRRVPTSRCTRTALPRHRPGATAPTSRRAVAWSRRRYSGKSIAPRA